MRESLFFTIEEFARMLDVDVETVASWERGESRPDAPTEHFIEQIARIQPSDAITL